MEKPFTIKVNEFQEDLTKLINESGLPALVLKLVIKEIYQQIEEADNVIVEEYKSKEEK